MQVPLRHSRDALRDCSGGRWRGISTFIIVYLTTELALFAKYLLHVSDFPFHFASDLFRRATVL